MPTAAPPAPLPPAQPPAEQPTAPPPPAPRSKRQVPPPPPPAPLRPRTLSSANAAAPPPPTGDAHAHARVSAPKAAPPKQHANEEWLRRYLEVPPDSPTALDELERVGVPRADIPRHTANPRFGPRSGLSDARRLLRAVRFNLLTPD